MAIRAKLLVALSLGGLLLQSSAESADQAQIMAPQLPEQAQQAINNALGGGRQMVQTVILYKKRVGSRYEYDVTPYVARGQESGDLIPDPNEVNFTVQGQNDQSAKEITITGTIRKSIFGLLPADQPREPITVMPSVTIQVGDSSCFWNCRKSGGSTTCQWTCVED